MYNNTCTLKTEGYTVLQYLFILYKSTIYTQEAWRTASRQAVSSKIVWYEVIMLAVTVHRTAMTRETSFLKFDAVNFYHGLEQSVKFSYLLKWNSQQFLKVGVAKLGWRPSWKLRWMKVEVKMYRNKGKIKKSNKWRVTNWDGNQQW